MNLDKFVLRRFFFFENSKFQFSNRGHFRYNLYFFMGLKYVWKVSRVFSYLQKFLPKPPTNQNNPTQKLEKIEKNDLFSDLIYDRNFCTMTEISTILKILNIFVSPKPVSWNYTNKPIFYIKLKKKNKNVIFVKIFEIFEFYSKFQKSILLHIMNIFSLGRHMLHNYAPLSYCRQNFWKNQF